MLEWLETDGLGGFASGTASGVRTRRYHGLLLTSQNPPADRFMLVNGIDAWLTFHGEEFRLFPQRYAGDVVTDALSARFENDVWPTWTFELPDGSLLRAEVFTPHERPAVALRWKLQGRTQDPVELHVRPLLSGRDPHTLQRENDAFRFGLRVAGPHIQFETYPDAPNIYARSNGTYRHEPVWYRRFEYEDERERGLDDIEDLASPGVFSYALRKEATLVLSTSPDIPGPEALARTESARRAQFACRLQRSASAYIVRRGQGHTIIAGYPWFGDWGRDTFIALRGISDRTVVASILSSWAGAVSEGMLPNRFPDRGETPEYNSVDASLWYVLAAGRALEASFLSDEEGRRVKEAIASILDGYSTGTRYGIRLDDDGLLAAGEPGVQLTWMDAKVGDWVVTPRVGKPVEIQALWLNALDVAVRHLGRYERELADGLSSFPARFFDAERGYLADVVDVNHEPGRIDEALRPNQIFAAGALPRSLVNDDIAARVVQVVEDKLWTPLGLRSLSPDHPDFVPRYQGGVRARDGAYHQGTVWPWLIGPFIRAWLHVRPDGAEEAHRRFVLPLLDHLNKAGIHHVSEIADGTLPHQPRGAPFQAWSVTELARIVRLVDRLRGQPSAVTMIG